MQPFVFGTDAESNRSEMDRFEAAAAIYKPSALVDEFAKRLDFYLHRQQAHVERTIKTRYPKTHADVLPYLETLRLTRFFVDETAKVFMGGHGLDLAKGEAPLASGSNEAKRWADVQDEMALGLKAKLLDRYTTLDRTAFLRVDREDGGPMTAQVFLAENVDIVPDPAFPFDLDRAYGVRLRIGGGEQDGQVVGANGEKPKGGRFEFWCAREGEERYHVIRGDGVLESVKGNESGAIPYRDGERGLIPLVMFTLHAEELGIFTDEGSGLWRANLSADVTASDLGYIAAVQGFGQLVIEYPESAARQQSEIVLGPTRAVPLHDGAKANMLSPSPQIAALLDLLDKKIRRAANLAGIPPGSVALEGRQIASGVALQIEMRPLLEARTDAIDFYRKPMMRLWRVIQVVHDARAKSGDPKFDGLTARWAPPDVQLPESETDLIERLGLEKRQGWRSDVEAVAKLRRISTEEAEKVLTEIRKTTKVVEPGPEDDPLGLKAKREALGGDAPADPAEGAGGGQ